MDFSWSQDKYIQASRFAAQYHQGQVIPGMDLPYILHPSWVCMEVMTALAGDQDYDADLAIQCALLHDVIEDTSATYEQLQSEFGSSVADGVRALTKNKTLAKSLQMQDSLRRILQQPHEVGMVKLADRITNLQPPPTHWPPAKIRHYWEEALEIYTALKDTNALLATRLLSKHDAYRTFLS
jgi:(p)ppGpp synthase/HD superfamily hydrolase